MTTYRGYIIEAVFAYKGIGEGMYDFEIHKEDDPEENWLRHSVTMQQVQMEIDEKIEESTLTI